MKRIQPIHRTDKDAINMATSCQIRLDAYGGFCEMINDNYLSSVAEKSTWRIPCEVDTNIIVKNKPGWQYSASFVFFRGSRNIINTAFGSIHTNDLIRFEFCPNEGGNTFTDAAGLCVDSLRLHITRYNKHCGTFHIGTYVGPDNDQRMCKGFMSH